MSKKPLRVTHRIQIGAFLEQEDFIYEITGFGDHGLVLTVREEVSGMESEIALQAILDGEYRYARSRRSLDNRNEMSMNPPAVGLPGHLVTKAKKMAKIIEGFEMWHEARLQRTEGQVSTSEILAEYVAQQGICVATYYNYRQVYRRYHGDVTAMAGSLHRSTYGKKRLSRSEQHFLDMIILKYPSLQVSELRRFGQSLLARTGGLWVDPERCDEIPEDLVEELCNPQIPIEVIVNHPEKQDLLVNIRLPGKTAFYEYYRMLTAQKDGGRTILDQRYGAGTWDRQLRVFDTFIHRAIEPLQYVFLDHYLLDVFTVDDKTRQKRDRLWLTLLLDTYTRSVLGLALLYEDPGILSVQSALQHAIWPKADVDGRAWCAYGVPVQLSLDNAWAHHSHSLESLARDPDLQIDLVYRPIYQGRYGALIERYFGNLAMRLQQRLKGAGSLSVSQGKASGNAAAQACLLYRDLYNFIIEEVVTYQNSTHSELHGLTPNQKWQEEEIEHGIVAPPPFSDGMQRKFWREYIGVRPVTDKGICLFGMQYQSAQLRQLPRFSAVAHKQDTGKTQRIFYSIRFNPHDISRIAIFSGATYLTDAYANQLRLSDGAYLSVSLVERELAKRLAHQQGSSDVGRDWVRYLDQLKETVRQRQAEKRQVHRMQTGQADASSTSSYVEPMIDASDWLEVTETALDDFWRP